MLGCTIAELALVVILGMRIRKLSVGAARAMFLGYAALTGVTFSLYFYMFDLTILIFAFGATALLFAGMAIAAKVFNLELSSIRPYLFAGLIALLIFKEKISPRLWIAIVLITAASILLSLSDITSFSVSVYSLLALLACCCWGLENNCTRKLSNRDPARIVIIKGFGSGTGSVIVALISGERLTLTPYILLALLLGFVAYGLSIYTYVYAQRYIGAAKTSAFYALAPFMGALISLALFPKIPALLFIISFVIMALGAFLAIEKERT
jgi:drug/metabolite transporter (DMT)-like permease